MGLKEQQNLLAKLYTDATYRSAFAADPSGVGSAAGLSLQELAYISSSSMPEIELFSESLFWKRAREVRNLLPITTRMLGDEFEPQFRAFATTFNSQSIKKHLDDATEFCRSIRENKAVSPATRDAAKFEQKKLDFFGRGRRFLFGTLKYHLTDPDTPSRRRSFKVWVRFRGRAHRFGW